jgi:hypothetical protein
VQVEALLREAALLEDVQDLRTCSTLVCNLSESSIVQAGALLREAALLEDVQNLHSFQIGEENENIREHASTRCRLKHFSGWHSWMPMTFPL